MARPLLVVERRPLHEKVAKRLRRAERVPLRVRHVETGPKCPAPSVPYPQVQFLDWVAAENQVQLVERRLPLLPLCARAYVVVETRRVAPIFRLDSTRILPRPPMSL